ncbi:hypothetical protein BAE44_0003955 [Dichanthelium oligosanthes]|uniref:Uncharacterized protein n=1 Tax=Dichanthelium oligosanthes TaxID=888268 RepID=A0A1E5WCD5_9POAL|nr:hypothetical protein BAE44_0003955 [Dichanthelium oligosanthes]
MSDTAVPLDLELRLGWGPRDVAPRSNSGTAAEGVRNGPGYGETRQRVEQAVGPMSDHGRTEQPTSAAAKVILPPPQVVQLAGSSSAHKRKCQEAGDDEAAAAETESKRAKTEPPPATVDDLTAPLFVQHVRASPPAARGAPRRGQRKKCSLNPPAAHHQGDGGATEPAWGRAELLTRHALPGDLSLHFVQEKELTGSDLKSEHSRLLIQSDGSKRLCALLSIDERRQCGLDGNRRRKKKPAQCQDGAKKERERSRRSTQGCRC